MMVKEESEIAALTFKILRLWHTMPLLHGKQKGKKWKQLQILFSWTQKSLHMMTASIKLKLAPWKESYDKPKQHIKKQSYHFANKGLYSQNYIFFPVVIYRCER